MADEETSTANGRRGPRRGAQQRLPESRRQLFELSRAGDLLTRTGLRAGPDSESGGSSAAASAAKQREVDLIETLLKRKLDNF